MVPENGEGETADLLNAGILMNTRKKKSRMRQWRYKTVVLNRHYVLRDWWKHEP
jgi:hypothetical protein